MQLSDIEQLDKTALSDLAFNYRGYVRLIEPADKPLEPRAGWAFRLASEGRALLLIPTDPRTRRLMAKAFKTHWQVRYGLDHDQAKTLYNLAKAIRGGLEPSVIGYVVKTMGLSKQIAAKPPASFKDRVVLKAWSNTLQVPPLDTLPRRSRHAVIELHHELASRLRTQ